MWLVAFTKDLSAMCRWVLLFCVCLVPFPVLLISDCAQLKLMGSCYLCKVS